ncbi:MAG TPA: hypothetical protein VGM84_14850 [Steroidobacteraceae bacterium]|jgi:DUF4097 and DUF4098 domain-containing protein YvlB
MNASTRYLACIALLPLLATLSSGPAEAAAKGTPKADSSANPTTNTITPDGDRTVVAFSDPSRPGTLRIGIIMGGITVKGTDRKDVLIETETHAGPGCCGPRRHREDESETPQGMRRLWPQQASMTVTEQNNEIKIDSPSFNRLVSFEIQVPKRTSLKLSTVNGGNLEIDGVDGELELSNVNGSIELKHVGGSVVAHTVNGKVLATVDRVSAEKPMAFTSLNGAVDVTFPPSIKCNLKLRSDNGSVFTDFDVATLPQPAPQVEDTRREGGRYRIDVNRGIYGSLNGGGPDIELRTFNGNVYVRKGS